MKLSNWIDSYGQKKLAEDLGVERCTVSCWRLGKRFPRPEMLHEINKRSRGRVSYKEMVTHFLNNK